jgi:hypothetical protein
MASKLIVNEIEHTDGVGTAVTMAKATIADATATLTAGTLGSGVIFPSGHVLQVVIGSNTAASTGTNVAHTSSSSSWPTIVSCAITPSAATSQILINSTVNMSGDGGSFTFHLLRGSQEVGQADPSSNRTRGYFSGGAMSGGAGSNQYDLATYSGVFLDDISSGTAWSSGSITYYIKVSFYHSAGTYRINRSESHRDDAAGFDGVASSHIVLQEIA